MTREALERAGQELWTDTELLPDFVGTDGDDVLTPKTAGVTWGMNGDDILVSEDNGHLNILIGGDGDDIYVLEPGSVSFILTGPGHDKLAVWKYAGFLDPFIYLSGSLDSTAISEVYRRLDGSGSEAWRKNTIPYRINLELYYDIKTKTTVFALNENTFFSKGRTFDSIVYAYKDEQGLGTGNSSTIDGESVLEWPEINQLFERDFEFDSIPSKALKIIEQLDSYIVNGEEKLIYRLNQEIQYAFQALQFYGNWPLSSVHVLAAELGIVNSLYDQILSLLPGAPPEPQAFELETSPTIKLTLGDNDTFIHQGSRISLPLIHSIDYTDDKSTGISVNIFYDSSVLTLPSAANRFINQVTTAGSIINEGVTEEGILIYENSLHDDTEDLDNDPSTDKFLNVTWGDISGQFPNIAGDELGILTFNTADELVDPITGEKTTTTVNVIPSGVPTGYQALNSSINFTPFDPRFSLDVDGDGTANAFSDGLMIIRKLLNYAFEGDALTNKAIAPEATRTTTEIHEYIQSGIDDLSLDIDKDGTVNPFSDGLMIIRAMLGNAFQGSALTDKALSAQSPYAADSAPWDSVKQNINELMPPDQPLA